MAFTLSACSSAITQTPARTCSIVTALQTIPAEVRETSGLTRGRVNKDVFWTHNDSGGEPELYAIGLDRRTKARVRLPGTTLLDWEDLEAGPCGNDYCLYIADIGDNAGRRHFVTIYEVVEAPLPAPSFQVKSTMHARYPDGPQDAEALFRLPSGELYIVTKGRQKSVRLYQIKPSGSEPTDMEVIRELMPQPRMEWDRITAASASPNGKWVAIRSYTTLFIYQTEELINGSGQPVITHLLRSLGERQGEALTLDDDGTIWVTSEAEQGEHLPTIGQIRCIL
jgi:hypothetical protein